jgi:hypothetical protein
METLPAERVTVMVLLHHAAMTALFATHPTPAQLRATFQNVADGLLPQVEGSPVLYGMYQATLEQLLRAIRDG